MTSPSPGRIPRAAGRRAAVLAVLLLTALAAQPRTDESVLLEAMEHELARSMAALRLPGQPAPYYIAYTVEDVTTSRLRARLGAREENFTNRARVLRVDVRVGDYAFDSSRFLSSEREAGVIPAYYATAGMTGSLDEDYDAIRRQLWVMTDAAYKHAVNVFARKTATFQNRADLDRPPDFSKEAPVEAVVPGAPAGLPDEAWRTAVERLSSVFTGYPGVQASQAVLAVTRGTRVFLNSEGARTITPIHAAVLFVEAQAQADDGMRLRDFVSETAARLADLAPPAVLEARVRAMAGRLVARRAAPVADDFTGPVLVEGQAAAELVAESLVPLFLGARVPESDTPRGEILSRQQGSPYLTRIGSRVLADFLSARDTPSLDRHEGRPVPGAYALDDEGVRAADVDLVKDGRLLTLLMGRTPQKRLPASNGHGRGGAVQAGVFQLAASQPTPRGAMKRAYLDLLKQQDRDFGFIVRSIAEPGVLRLADSDADEMAAIAELLQGGSQAGRGPRVLECVKVFPDGREVPVRGLTFGEVTRIAFKEILAASDVRQLHSTRVTASAAGSPVALLPGAGGDVTVSVIVPDLLFEELELERSRDIGQRPPIVPPPDKGSGRTSLPDEPVLQKRDAAKYVPTP